MKISQSTIHGGANDSIRATGLILFAVVLLLPSVAAAIDPPDPLNVLFVANGYYSQEDDIEDHFLDLGHNVTRMKDYKVKGTTNLAPYDLIVITEFAPGIPSTGINNIKASGKPVLIVEYWDFWYSYRFGLTTTDDCGYVGTDRIEHVDTDGLFHEMLGSEVPVYSSTYTIYGIPSEDIADGVTPLAFSSRSFDEYAVLLDAQRKIAATGVYDTRRYTEESWRYFDLLLGSIAQIGPQWPDTLSALDGFARSGLMSYLDHLTGSEDPLTVRTFVWKTMLTYNLWEFQHPIEEQLLALNPAYSLFLYGPVFKLGSCTHYNILEYPEMCWMLGQHEETTGSYAVPEYGGYITGADLGISVERWGRTYFYMGDTWGNAGGQELCERSAGIGRAECDDAIVLSAPWEDDPSNGLDLEVLVQNSGFRPTNINGVHRSFGDEVWAEWNGDPEANNNGDFSAPTGALVHSVDYPVFVPAFGNYPAYDSVYPLPQTQLWYATQNTVQESPGEPNPRAGKSWVGCSTSGTWFENCYEFIGDGGQPDFAYFSKKKFMQVSPVFIEAYMLDFMDPSPQHTAMGGYLLYGTGHPYRCSPVYLAYIDASDFGFVSGDRPRGIYFFSTLGGSPDWVPDNEEYASPITEYAGCLVTEQAYVDAGLEAEWNETLAIWQAVFDELLWEWKAIHPLELPLCNSLVCGLDPETTLCKKAFEEYDIECSFCSEESVFECAGVIAETYMRRPAPDLTSGFGELSVKIVSGGDIGGGIQPTIVMLSNHTFWGDSERTEILNAIDTGTFDRNDYNWRFSRIYLRTASIYSPWELSEPVNTGNTGYGPYIVDMFTELTPSLNGEPNDPNSIWGYTVSLWHTASSWHGPALPGAYGTYTTRSEFWLPEY